MRDRERKDGWKESGTEGNGQKKVNNKLKCRKSLYKN